MAGPTKSQIPDLGKMLAKVGDAVLADFQKASEGFMEDSARDFRNRIKAQRFRSFQLILYPDSGTNLSPRWLARKESKGADLRTMIATGHYVRNIKVHSKKVSSSKRQYRVGFHPGIQARNLDGERVPLKLWELALIQEFGYETETSVLPPRPHWRPYHAHIFTPRAKRLRKALRTRLAATGRKAVGAR